MRHRIYLDTHFIDYLFDHRAYIWDGKHGSLDRAEREHVGDDQLDEYAWLGAFPQLCWMNDWWVRIGDRVFDELARIRRSYRRRRLVEYAQQLSEQAIYEPWDDDLDDSPEDEEEEGEPPKQDPRQYSMFIALGFRDDAPDPDAFVPPAVFDPTAHDRRRREFPRSPAEALAKLPTKDRPLVEEALALACDVFLTTDQGILSSADVIEEWFGLKLRTWTQLIYEESSAGRLRLLDDWRWPEGGLLPELEIYTKLIPSA